MPARLTTTFPAGIRSDAESMPETSIARLPCWKHHDAETLAAFDRVFDRANDKHSLCGSLRFAGLLDADAQPIVRKLFDSSVIVEYLDHLAGGAGTSL